MDCLAQDFSRAGEDCFLPARCNMPSGAKVIFNMNMLMIGRGLAGREFIWRWKTVTQLPCSSPLQEKQKAWTLLPACRMRIQRKRLFMSARKSHLHGWKILARMSA